ITSENQKISILKEQQKGWEYNKKGFWVFHTRILGKNIGDSTVFIAQLKDLKTSLKVEIIKKDIGRIRENGVNSGFL
ncbi:MAG: hypothetical protein Q8P63_01825, partial [Candidatus Nealsonbacteria bacterium]|nr:hypothetical protein [Candidatus Nealsonbacteria bacterium]